MMVGTQRVDGSLPPLNSPKSYGITKPLSLAGPSAADTKRNLELEKFLVDEGLYESNEDTMRREEVLGRIDQEEYCGKTKCRVLRSNLVEF